ADQHAIARLVAAREVPAGWGARAVVSDAAHLIIASSEQAEPYIGNELPRTQWQGAGPSGVFEFIDSGGRPSLQASTRSDLTGWETAGWGPKALLEAPRRVQWRAVGALALLGLGVVGGSAFWAG